MEREVDRTEVNVITRWMCGFILNERKNNVELREVLALKPSTW